MVSGANEYPEGTILGGKFRVVRTLGIGGMGAVYEVQHTLTQHRRALKILKADSENAEAKVRLLREASAAGRIGNPHIVETFDAGELDTGAAYVVMELLDGEDLSAYLKRVGRLSNPELAGIARQACEGLHAAHLAGIVYRDIKPGNIFLTNKEGQRFVKLVDFGVSKFDSVTTDETELTRDGAVIGTPSYMSPEQVRGDANLDARVDVYALGVLLYVALTGKRPFTGTSLAQVALRIVQGECTPLRELRPDISVGFAQVVARAMAVDRSERFPTALALAVALVPYEKIDHGALDAPTVSRQRPLMEMPTSPSSGANGSQSHARIDNPPSMTPLAVQSSPPSTAETAVFSVERRDAGDGGEVPTGGSSVTKIRVAVAAIAVAATMGLVLGFAVRGRDAHAVTRPVAATEPIPTLVTVAPVAMPTAVPLPPATASAEPAPPAMASSTASVTGGVAHTAPAVVHPDPTAKPTKTGRALERANPYK